MDTTQKQTQKNTTGDTTKKSLEEGHKAIEINKKIEQGPNKKDKDEKEKQDEEQWRNEG